MKAKIFVVGILLLAVLNLASFNVLGDTIPDAELVVLDTYVVASPRSDQNPLGWGLSPAPGTWGGYTPISDIRVIWGAGDTPSNDPSAFFRLWHKGGNGKKIRMHHLDGLADDSFDVIINGILVFHYTSDVAAGIKPPGTSEVWKTTEFYVDANLPDIYAGGIKVYDIELKATGPMWGGFGTWGQVAFTTIELLGVH